MYRIIVLLIIIMGTIRPHMLPAVGEEPPQQPSAKERLSQVLGPDGGVQVYKDHQGNVTNTTVLPNGERITTVQPPQSQGFNVGPPLQLNNRALTFPPPPPPSAQPPAPGFPQRAR